jgi:hypothetical protein
MSVSNTIITIKRSQTTAEPPSLSNGELAYSFSSNKLFIGQTDNANSAVTVEYIGGKLIVDKVANLELAILSLGSQSVSANSTITNQLKLTYATNNSVLFAKTDGIVDFITGSSGKILQIAANGTPTFDDLNGGGY